VLQRIAAKCPSRSDVPDPEPAPTINTTGGTSGCRARIAAHAPSSAATIGALIAPDPTTSVDAVASTSAPTSTLPPALLAMTTSVGLLARPLGVAGCCPPPP
jgi:hypothetical protein